MYFMPPPAAAAIAIDDGILLLVLMNTKGENGGGFSPISSAEMEAICLNRRLTSLVADTIRKQARTTGLRSRATAAGFLDLPTDWTMEAMILDPDDSDGLFTAAVVG